MWLQLTRHLLIDEDGRFDRGSGHNLLIWKFMTRKPEKVAKKTEGSQAAELTKRENHETRDGIERKVQTGQAIGPRLKTK